MTNSEFFIDELDAMRDLLRAGLVRLGFSPILEAVIKPDVKWRPDAVDLTSDPPVAVEIAMDGLVPEWLDLQSARDRVPGLKLFVVIPDVVPVPHATVQFATNDKNTAVYVLKSDVLELVFDATDQSIVDPARHLKYSAGDLKKLGIYSDEFNAAVRICNSGENRDALYAVGAAGRALERACKDTFNIAINSRYLYFPKRVADSKLEKWDTLIHTMQNPIHTNANRTYNRKKSLVSKRHRDQILVIKEARNIADHPSNEDDELEVIENAPSYVRITHSLLKILLLRQRRLQV